MFATVINLAALTRTTPRCESENKLIVFFYWHIYSVRINKTITSSSMTMTPALLLTLRLLSVPSTRRTVSLTPGASLHPAWCSQHQEAKNTDIKKKSMPFGIVVFWGYFFFYFGREIF